MAMKKPLEKRAVEVERESGRATDRKSERLSNRELRELMGVYRDTYKRVNGAVRRK